MTTQARDTGGRGRGSPAAGPGNSPLSRSSRPASASFVSQASGPNPTERGSVTAELAVGLPVLVLLLLAGLTAVGAATTTLRCLDAAREAALAAARGEPGIEAAERLAPAGAEIEVTRGGDTVQATVRAPVPLLGVRLPGGWVEASSVAAVEPGYPGPPP